jgi:hypothetical protein
MFMILFPVANINIGIELTPLASKIGPHRPLLGPGEKSNNVNCL